MSMPLGKARRRRRATSSCRPLPSFCRVVVPPVALLPVAVTMSPVAMLPRAVIVPPVVLSPVAVVVPRCHTARHRRCAACRPARPCRRCVPRRRSAPCRRRAARHRRRAASCHLSPRPVESCAQ